MRNTILVLTGIILYISCTCVYVREILSQVKQLSGENAPNKNGPYPKLRHTHNSAHNYALRNQQIYLIDRQYVINMYVLPDKY